MSSPTSHVSLWEECRWVGTPRVGGSEAGRSEHPAAAQMCLFELGAGKGASKVTVGPSPGCCQQEPAYSLACTPEGQAAPAGKLECCLPGVGVRGSRAQRPCLGSRVAQGFSNRCPHSLKDLERNGSSGAGDGGLKPKGSHSQLLTMALIGTGSGPWPGGATRISDVAGPLIPGAGAMASCSLLWGRGCGHKAGWPSDLFDGKDMQDSMF